MANEYSISIRMDQATAHELLETRFNLYAFKAVEGPPNGTPLVWARLSTYSNNIVIRWTESYQAYTAATVALDAGRRIDASAQFPIEAGQVLSVTDPTGYGVVSGPPGQGDGQQAITIVNQTNQTFICGISQAPGRNNSHQPLCAFPLFGSTMDRIVPVQKVLLMFSDNPMDLGTVVERSFSDGVLVDLTGANERSVTFDIRSGWAVEPWATHLQVQADLVPLLITSGT